MTRFSPPPPPAVPWLLAVTVAAAAGAAGLVVLSRPLAGGVAGLVAVVASFLAGVAAKRSGARLVFADHAVERLLEAALFGSIAWVAIPDEVWTAAAALSALITSYLASYLSAKAIGLGFELRERVPYRSARPLVAVVGLLVPEILDVALWAAAVISLEPVVRHGASVARQREPA